MSQKNISNVIPRKESSMLKPVYTSFIIDRNILHTLLLTCLIYLAYPSNSYSYDASRLNEENISFTDDDIIGEKVRVFLIAKNEATISSETDGKIISLPFVMGQSFNKGDLLVELDSELAEAAKDKAEKELEANKVNLEAIKDLRSREDATLVELVNAEKDTAIAEAGLILAKKNLQMCRIHAPFSGRVIKVEKHEYELTKTGEPVISIINDNMLLAHFLLPISEFPNTKIGAEIKITIPLLKKSFTARISQISATLDAASNTFEVAADIDNSDKILRAGMSGWFRPEKNSSK